jgi:DNA polymerase
MTQESPEKKLLKFRDNWGGKYNCPITIIYKGLYLPAYLVSSKVYKNNYGTYLYTKPRYISIHSTLMSTNCKQILLPIDSISYINIQDNWNEVLACTKDLRKYIANKQDIKITKKGISALERRTEKLKNAIAKINIDPSIKYITHKSVSPIKFTWAKARKIIEAFPDYKFSFYDLSYLFGFFPISEIPAPPSYLSVENNKVYFKKIKKMSKKSKLTSLKEIHDKCIECKLGTNRLRFKKNLVFGRGDPNANILILGESPGKQEEEEGYPFYEQAPAGNILYRVMNRVGINQDTCFITNTVICRPVETIIATRENRQPTEEEILACRTRLKQTLKIVDPKLVILLGKIAHFAFTGESPKSMKDIIGYKQYGKFECYTTYHPSYVARNQENQELMTEYLKNWTEIKGLINEL